MSDQFVAPATYLETISFSSPPRRQPHTVSTASWKQPMQWENFRPWEGLARLGNFTAHIGVIVFVPTEGRAVANFLADDLTNKIYAAPQKIQQFAAQIADTLPIKKKKRQAHANTALCAPCIVDNGDITPRAAPNLLI